VKVSGAVPYLDRAVFLNLLCAEMLDKLKENCGGNLAFDQKSAPDCGSRDDHLELLAGQ
jgi:hypothetical protein